MTTDDLGRMRRQALLTRYATLNGLGLPVFCHHLGRWKVIFPDRDAAENYRDQVEQEWPDQHHQQAYLCASGRRHYHLTRDKSDERKAS